MASKKQQSTKPGGKNTPSGGKNPKGAGGGASKGKPPAAAKKEAGEFQSQSSPNRKGMSGSSMDRTSAKAKSASTSGRVLPATKKAGALARGAVVVRNSQGEFRAKANPDVTVSRFEPERGFAVLESRSGRVRYTRERTPDQLVTMADYLRARRGFSTDQEMADILQVHRTRLAAWKQGSEVPNTQNAQLLSFLAVVVIELEEFLDADVIPDWLSTDQYTLGMTPVDALRGGQLASVLQAANELEHGAYV